MATDFRAFLHEPKYNECGAMPLWMERFDSDDVAEVADNKPWRIRMLPTYLRTYIAAFTIRLLGLSKALGNIGPAYSLMERYLAVYFKNISLSSHSIADRERKKDEIKENLLLLVAVCIRLTAKMDSAQFSYFALSRKNTSLSLNINYTTEELNALESKVLTALHFYIPSWTNADKVGILANHFGISEVPAIRLMELAEIKRVTVQRKLLAIEPTADCFEFGPGDTDDRAYSNGDVHKIRTLHLIGAAVAASAVFTQSGASSVITPHLAVYAKCSESILLILRDCILDLMPIDQSETSPATQPYRTRSNRTVKPPKRLCL